MPELAIRGARPADDADLAAVHVRSWQDAYRGSLPDDYLDRLSPADRLPAWTERLADAEARERVLVAELDGAIVGFAAWRPHPTRGADWAELPQLYLDPAVIGRGVGRALMDEVLGHAEALGCRHIELGVHPDNERARRFYEAGGWTTDGEVHVEHAWGVDLPCVVYARAIGASS